MNRQKRAENAKRLFMILLFVGSILAAVKVIFVDYTLDEEYQVVMAYRNMSGDPLFGAMWEPHQTSAFLCVFLMRIYTTVTGTTTGVVLFLRVCTTGIQLLLSLWLCRVLKRITEEEYAVLLGLLYFNIVPKIIQIPEFSNLQVWCYTVTVLALFEYYAADVGRKRRFLWIVTAGAGMSLAVLSYPSSLLLFPFFLVVICYKSARYTGFFRKGLRDALFFASTCGICAAMWLAGIFCRVTPEEFLRNIRYILDFDATHDLALDAEYRSAALVREFTTLLLLLAVVLIIALLIWWLIGRVRKRLDPEAAPPGSAVFAVCAVLSAELVQLWYWLWLRVGYEIPQIHLMVVLISGILLLKGAGDNGKKALMGLLAGLIVIVSVLYMSDLGLWYAIPHGLTGVVFAVAIILDGLRKQERKQAKCWAYVLLFSLAFLSVFGKGFVLRAGMIDTNTVLGIRGVIKKGPAAGIFTNYIQAYITNETYEEFQEYVEPGSNLLIVTNLNGTAGTSPYLFNDGKVCHFSIVDPTTYDERLLEYWALYPQKKPEVIIVDCWYGELREDPDSWIMRYIEEEFGYTDVVDGKYVRYYFKR